MTQQEKNELGAVMGGGCITIAVVLVLILLTLLFTGCSKKIAQPTIVEHERTITNTRTEYLHDTVYFDVPAQTAEAVVLDSVSVLENDFAITTARINPNGTLFHTLATKPQSVSVPFEKPVETKSQVIYRNREVKVPMPVEKPLTPWEKFRLDAFWWLVGACAAGAVVAYRKPLFTLIRRFI